MLPLTIILLIVLSKTEAASTNTNTSCGDFQAKFDMKSVIGPWYVVAIIPGTMFPDKDVLCYKVEFSETDEAGLRWLVNRTLHSQEATKDVRGTIIRQRYHSEHAFDVWSRAVEGTNGCFQQVLSMDSDSNDIHKGLVQNAKMQLHFLEESSDPFLLQLLWGEMVSTVIYRKSKNVITLEQLKPVMDLITQLRGPQKVPKICSKQYQEKIVLD